MTLEDCCPSTLARAISNDQFKNVIVMVGAGISVSCGIPDFRSPGTGLYDNLQRYNLPTPQHVFDLQYFKSTQGKAFYELAAEMWPTNYFPSPGHAFIKLLEEKEILLRCYTQNIDTLERRCGISDKKLVEAHGSFSSASCVKCGASFCIEKLEELLKARKTPVLCEICGSLVKPDIVFFGESLPERFSNLVKQDFRECDLLFIMGTSLSVQPFASLIDLVSPTVPRVLMNMQAVGTRTPFTFGKGLRLFQKDNLRDYFIPGEIDNSVRGLCDIVGDGWRADLESIVRESKSKGVLIDEEESIPIDWMTCFNILPSTNCSYCHSIEEDDFPELQAPLKADDLETKFNNLKISVSRNCCKLLIIDKEAGIYRLVLKGSSKKSWDEDDYMLIVPEGTTYLAFDSMVDSIPLSKVSFCDDEKQEHILKVDNIYKGELWYVSNEMGKVIGRFTLS